MAPSSAFKRLVAWRRNGCTVLAGSRTFVHGKLVPPYTSLDVEPLGHNTSLFSYFALFPCDGPRLVSPKSNLSSLSKEVSRVLSV